MPEVGSHSAGSVTEEDTAAGRKCWGQVREVIDVMAENSAARCGLNEVSDWTMPGTKYFPEDPSVDNEIEVFNATINAETWPTVG
ncbi:hypothetical protein GCM10009611_26030 [Arthrobacter roseus]